MGAAATGTAAPVYLIPDRQGTDQFAIDGVTEAVTRQQFTPFGTPRGTPPSTWPGDKGYVGGTPDPARGGGRGDVAEAKAEREADDNAHDHDDGLHDGCLI